MPASTLKTRPPLQRISIRAWRAEGSDPTNLPPGIGPIWFAVAIDLWLENAAAL